MSLTVEMTLVELLNKVPQGGPQGVFLGGTNKLQLKYV